MPGLESRKQVSVPPPPPPPPLKLIKSRNHLYVCEMFVPRV